MITDSNHACFTKMSGCGFQEVLGNVRNLLIDPYPRLRNGQLAFGLI